jgi:iron complex transport system substrate-binding protein
MRSIRKSLVALFILVGVLAPIAAGASGPAAKAAFPVTLKFADGTFTITKSPTSIVSLSPTATEMLYAIGAGPQVKAVDEYSDYPTTAPKTSLNGYEPNVEAIAKYNPDLIIVAVDPAGFLAQMKALKIPVLYEPTAGNLSAAYAQYGPLGEATGHAPQAQKEVETIKTKIAHIIATTHKAAAGTTYYYEVDPTYYSATSTTFVGQLFALLGLKSIADSAKGVASSGGYPQLSAEFILRANPAYIFLADTVCCRASATSISRRPGWSAMSAVKNHRIVPLNDDIASRWGPRIVILLQDVANALNGKQVSTSS